MLKYVLIPIETTEKQGSSAKDFPSSIRMGQQFQANKVMTTQRCKGSQDLLPEDMTKFRYIEKVFRSCCLGWGYKEIRTPTLEYLHLFTSTGTLTPSMLNRVYSFLDWNGCRLLRDYLYGANVCQHEMRIAYCSKRWQTTVLEDWCQIVVAALAEERL